MPMLISVGMLIFAASITPGPNNLIVLGAAMDRGIRGALPAIAGVVTGSLILLGIVSTGVTALLIIDPKISTLLALSGSAYLLWVGGVMILRAGEGASRWRGQLPSTTNTVALFQFVNPKAWLLVSGAVTSMADGSHAAVSGFKPILGLAITIATVTSASLFAWAFAGTSLKDALVRPNHQRAFDHLIGGVVVLCAMLLLSEALS